MPFVRRGRSDPRHDLGRRAEQRVAEYLEARGYTIVERNARVGRLEIDLVARRGRLVVFCEVRARRAGGLVHPLETIGPAKIERMRRAARAWLLDHGRRGEAVRLDVAAVTLGSDGLDLEYVADAV